MKKKKRGGRDEKGADEKKKGYETEIALKRDSIGKE